MTTPDPIRYDAQAIESEAQVHSGARAVADARRFDGATILDVLRVHPMMIVHGQIVRNPYYTRPSEFLARHGTSRQQGG